MKWDNFILNIDHLGWTVQCVCSCACYILRTIMWNVLYQVRTFLTCPSKKVSGDSAADYSWLLHWLNHIAPFLRTGVTIVTRAIRTLTSEADAGNTPEHRKLVHWWCWGSWAEHLPRPMIWSLDLIACPTFLQQKFLPVHGPPLHKFCHTHM